MSAPPYYRCASCPLGFKMNGNRTFCEDIDECAFGLSNCGDNSQCENTIGSYSCLCYKGFIQNLTFGCNAMPNICPDGIICNKNAICNHIGGSRVSPSSYRDTKIASHLNLNFNSISVFVKLVSVAMVARCVLPIVI